MDTVADMFNVHGCDQGKPVLNEGSGVFRFSANANCRTAIYANLQYDFQCPVHLLLPELPPQSIILNLMLDPLSYIS